MPDTDSSNPHGADASRHPGRLPARAAACAFVLLAAPHASSQPPHDARQIEIFGGARFIPWTEEAGANADVHLGATAWLWERWGLSAEVVPYRDWEYPLDAAARLHLSPAVFFQMRRRIPRGTSTWHLGFGGAILLPDPPKRYGRREIPPVVPVPVFEFLVGPRTPGGWDVKWGGRLWGLFPQLALQIGYTLD